MSIGHCGGYIVQTRSLIFLQEYEIDRSSGGVQENLRKSRGPLTVIQVTGYAY